MTKMMTATAAALALSVATLLLSPAAQAMPVDGLAIATARVADGIQNVRGSAARIAAGGGPTTTRIAPATTTDRRGSTATARAPSIASDIAAGAGEAALRRRRAASDSAHSIERQMTRRIGRVGGAS